MTVKQLIEKLSEVDQNAIVCVQAGETETELRAQKVKHDPPEDDNPSFVTIVA